MRRSYINSTSSILNRPPFSSPAMMAILTQANRTAQLGTVAYPTPAQLSAITSVQELIEPILRVQDQFAGVSTAADSLAEWANSLRQAADPLQGIRSALSAIDSEQFQIFSSAVYGAQIATAIQPALRYLKQEHPDVYQEIAPAPNTRPRKKTHIRRRALESAERLAIQANVSLIQFDAQLRNMPLGKLSFYLAILGEISDAAPDDIAQSIHILVAIFMISFVISNKGYNHEHEPE